MKSLKDFLNSSSGTSKSLDVARKQVSLDVAESVSVSGLVSTKSKAVRFGQEVTELAVSDDVISQLSDQLGEPLSSESEEEFVLRAKATFKKILMARLS